LLTAPARNMAIVAGLRCNCRAIPINPDAAGPDTVNAHASSSLSQHLSNLPAAASASACARVASASCSPRRRTTAAYRSRRGTPRSTADG
jgi:hypothetical protein